MSYRGDIPPPFVPIDGPKVPCNLGMTKCYCRHMHLTVSAENREIYLAGERHILVDDVAVRCRVHRRTVMRWLASGKLTRRTYAGRNICVPAAEVEALQEARR